MTEPYLPQANFIWMAAEGNVPLKGSTEGEANLALLIAFTRDADVSNRDWATMTLAMQDIDTPDVRAALIAATNDEDCCVRGEALEGLADRDKGLALSFLCCELMREECAYPTFKAAQTVAHRALLAGLRKWEGRGGASWIDSAIVEAIAACEAAPATDF